MTWCNNIRGLTLNFKFLEQKGVSSGFLTQWMDGVKFHGDAVQPRFHRNHPSMTKHALWAEAEWSRLEKLGKLYFFPKGESKPFGLNVNPCGLIIKARPDAQQAQNECDKYKVRLIVDLTRGLVNPALSNKAVQYGTVERAVSRMCSGDFLFVVDLMDCFFTWRVLPADSMLLGFYSESRQQFGKYDYLANGLKPAPGINDASVKEILRVLELDTGTILTDFVDDLLGASRTEENAWHQLETTVEFYLHCGIPISSKASGVKAPAQRLVWTGWVFDTVLMVVTVTAEKCKKCCVLLVEILDLDDSRQLFARTLAEGAGLVSHIAEVYPQAQRRLHPVWADLNASGVYALWQRSPKANPLVCLSELSRKNVAWLIQAFQSPPCRALHAQNGELSCWGVRSPDYENWKQLALDGKIFVIETDASKLKGWSYHLCSSGKVVSGEWPPDFATTESENNADHINYKELWVALRCVRDQKSLLRGWRVLFRVDSSAAEHYVNIRYGRIPSLKSLAARLDDAEKDAMCWCLAVHIPGKFNRIADLGSRDSSFAQRWANDPYHHARLRPDLFAEVQSRCGVKFSIDLFADRRGLNSLVSQWRCPELTAFETDLTNHTCWAHPPRALIRSSLEHFNAYLVRYPSAQIVLLLPEDSNAPWFRPSLLSRWQRVRSWDAGSDIMRWMDETPAGDVRWRKGPRTDFRYSVFRSWNKSK